jgi:hypothetical protein
MEDFLREIFPGPDVWDRSQVTGFRISENVTVKPDQTLARLIRKLIVKEKALSGNLPAWSPHWSMKCRDGKPLAFLAARFGTLPARFRQWEISDSKGRTVAHEAAAAGTLPREFGYWELEDRTGWTVKDEDFMSRYGRKRRKRRMA